MKWLFLSILFWLTGLTVTVFAVQLASLGAPTTPEEKKAKDVARDRCIGFLIAWLAVIVGTTLYGWKDAVGESDQALGDAPTHLAGKFSTKEQRAWTTMEQIPIALGSTLRKLTLFEGL